MEWYFLASLPDMQVRRLCTMTSTTCMCAHATAYRCGNTIVNMCLKCPHVSI